MSSQKMVVDDFNKDCQFNGDHIIKKSGSCPQRCHPASPPIDICQHQLTSRFLFATLPGCFAKTISRIQEYAIIKLSAKGKKWWQKNLCAARAAETRSSLSAPDHTYTCAAGLAAKGFRFFGTTNKEIVKRRPPETSRRP